MVAKWKINKSVVKILSAEADIFFFKLQLF